MTIGTTSFGFRYQLLDPARAPSMQDLIRQALALELDALQICENARPLALHEAEWRDLIAFAGENRLLIGFGCKTTQAPVFEQFLALARLTPGRTLRLVFEEESGSPLSRECVDTFLRSAAPRLLNAGVRLAIENHFVLPSRTLREAVEPYPESLIGFCVDTANSLRNFESPEQVLELLGPRALCYHIKDYGVQGHVVGFEVGGAPLGRGKLRLRPILQAILEKQAEPEIYLENWVPPSGDRDADMANDERWLKESLAFLKLAVQQARCGAGSS